MGNRATWCGHSFRGVKISRMISGVPNYDLQTLTQDTKHLLEMSRSPPEPIRDFWLHSHMEHEGFLEGGALGLGEKTRKGN